MWFYANAARRDGPAQAQYSGGLDEVCGLPFRVRRQRVNGHPPAKSGLPALATPTKGPGQPGARFSLAVILYLPRIRPTPHLSRREFQEIRAAGSRKTADNHIRGLVDDGFLFIPARKGAKGGRSSDADELRPGKRLRGVTKKEWDMLATALFEPGGICVGLLGRWAFGSTFLGHNGMLILGALKNSRRPLSVSELADYLGFFISNEQTIRNRLKRAEKHSLVLRLGTGWTISKRFEQSLLRYEETEGPNLRRHRVRTQNSLERRAFGITLRGGLISPRDEISLQRMGCIRCGKSNYQHRLETDLDLTMEHFPPRAWLKQWGITDHLDLNWALCRSENSHYGQIVKRVPTPTLDRFIRLSLREPSEESRVVIAKLEILIRRFYRAIDNGDDERAARIAAHAFVMWHGLIKGPLTVFLDATRSSVTVTTSHRSPASAATPAGASRRLSRRVQRVSPTKAPARHAVEPWKGQQDRLAGQAPKRRRQPARTRRRTPDMPL